MGQEDRTAWSNGIGKSDHYCRDCLQHSLNAFCCNQELCDCVSLKQRSLWNHKHNIITPHLDKVEILLKPLGMSLVFPGLTYNNLVILENSKPRVWERGQCWGYQLWCSLPAPIKTVFAPDFLHDLAKLLPAHLAEGENILLSPVGVLMWDTTNECSLEQGWCSRVHSSTQWNCKPFQT